MHRPEGHWVIDDYIGPVSNLHIPTQCAMRSYNLPPDSSQSLVDIRWQNLVSGLRLARHIRPTFRGSQHPLASPYQP